MEIALSLSGGGYRAAVYHLGVISYLESLKMPEDECLLDYVNSISGISGGALITLSYSLSESDNVGRKGYIRDMYNKIISNNLGDLVIKKASSQRKKVDTLIQSLSKVYSDVFFNNTSFEQLLDCVDNPECHLHHIAVCATDFNNGVPFRFQATKRINNLSAGVEYGPIGNEKYEIPRDIARKILIADIMAATSCFPLAFEPFVYPKDFRIDDKNDSDNYVPLMDGGIIDNQGVDPILQASEHLKMDGEIIDAFIISDVANKDISALKQNKIEKKWFTIDKIRDILALFAVALFIFSYLINRNLAFVSGLLFALGIVVVFVIVIAYMLLLRIEKKFSHFFSFEEKINLRNLRLHNFYDIISVRIKSIYKMMNDVVMVHVRNRSIESLFSNINWKDKIILNAEYMLSTTGPWKEEMQKYNLPKKFRPSDELLEETDACLDMPTTLWFTKENKDENMSEKIFACGQYSMCWNLMCLVWKIKNKKINNPALSALLKLETQLQNDWELFKRDPQFMLNKYLKS